MVSQKAVCLQGMHDVDFEQRTCLKNSSIVTRSGRALFFLVAWVALAATQVSSGHAQVALFTTAPNVDSFPVVKIRVGVSENGHAASVDATNFSVAEDGAGVTGITLSGCDTPPSTAIAIVLDTSSSIRERFNAQSELDPPFQYLRNSISVFLQNIPAPTNVTLVPFSDTASYSAPGAPAYFYNSSAFADTSALTARMKLVKFNGEGTFVDFGLDEAIRTLGHSTKQQKVVVLITDDFFDDEAYVRYQLQLYGITLYVMQFQPDGQTIASSNQQIAQATGGDYYGTYLPEHFAPAMAAIAQRIFATHCDLRYVSSLGCPWLISHKVDVTLDYKNVKRYSTLNYVAPKNPHDTLAPRGEIDSSVAGCRVVRAREPYPCESGMQILFDSAHHNFRLAKRTFTTNEVASDSLIVIDSLHPADAWYLARDTAGNVSRIHVHYTPTPDTHAPEFGPSALTMGAYALPIWDTVAWDRGIASVTLDAASTNLQLDQVSYSTGWRAVAKFHIRDLAKSASGCIVVVDSAGNTSRSCVSWLTAPVDDQPPVFAQDPLNEPRTMMTGTVTDERPNDRGLKSVRVTPIRNASFPSAIFTSVTRAYVSASIIDSLQPSRALVEATDSADHITVDTLRADPLADSQAPVITSSTISTGSYLFTVTEKSPWDRGILSVAIDPASTNYAVTAPTFTNARLATINAYVTSLASDATITIVATDSAGHISRSTVTYQTPVSQVQQFDTLIDFGTVPPPALLTRKITIKNTSSVPILVSIPPPAGDDSVFSLVNPNTFPLSANNFEVLTFSFHPTLVGKWKAVYIVEHDGKKFGTITLIGESIGGLDLVGDTVHVPHADMWDTLHIAIDVSPKPVNLDTIRFTLNYDKDLVTFGDLPTCPAGSLDTGLCVFDIRWIDQTEGRRRIEFARRSNKTSPFLSYDRTVLSIPFRTFVARDTATAVTIDAITGSPVHLGTSSPGRITVGDTCGTPVIRTAMRGELTTEIFGIRPNPAKESMALTVRNAIEGDVELRFVDVSGKALKAREIHLPAGSREILLTNLPDASGAYQVQLLRDGRIVASRPVEIVH